MAAAIEQRRVALQSFGYLLHDAPGSLVHGYIPTTLISPDVLIKIFQMTEKGILVEAIPRSLLSAYYSFELVRETYISDKGVHVLLEIPLHSSAGLHNVMRATRRKRNGHPVSIPEKPFPFILGSHQFRGSERRAAAGALPWHQPAETLQKAFRHHRFPKNNVLNRLVLQLSLRRA